MLEAHIAALVFLYAIVPVESTALKLTRQHIGVVHFVDAVVYTAKTTAISVIIVAFWLVVFSIARAISQPHSDTFHDFCAHFLLRDNFRNDLATVVAIVYH